jgi:hypothetical protein
LDRKDVGLCAKFARDAVTCVTRQSSGSRPRRSRRSGSGSGHAHKKRLCRRNLCEKYETNESSLAEKAAAPEGVRTSTTHHRHCWSNSGKSSSWAAKSPASWLGRAAAGEPRWGHVGSRNHKARALLRRDQARALERLQEARMLEHSARPRLRVLHETARTDCFCVPSNDNTRWRPRRDAPDQTLRRLNTYIDSRTRAGQLHRSSVSVCTTYQDRPPDYSLSHEFSRVSPPVGYAFELILQYSSVIGGTSAAPRAS